MKTNQHEDLLRYYKDELTYLRRMGGEFAALYPRVAARLELGRDECADPQVERLLESFAFLTARLQRDLDGELPEITTALLGILYPQLVNPVPPMSVARFDVDPEQGKLTTGFRLEKHTQLFAYTAEGHTCRFRTCYPVTLWPLAVEYAAFEDTGQFDFLDSMTNVAAVLRLKLKVLGGALADLELKRLRFYLSGDAALAGALYELLFSHVRGVALLPEGEAQPVHLPAGSVLPVGFRDEEDVLPYPAQSHPGYRLLQEYFAFPEKFHFFDLDHLDAHRRGSTLDIHGTEVFLSFLDLDFRPARPPLDTVYAHALCTNRELATQLPAGAALQIEEQAPLFGISCLTKPTQPAQPPLRGAALWRLVSHLSLNHLSLSEGHDSLAALREILKLYSSTDRPSTQQQIMGLTRMECRK